MLARMLPPVLLRRLLSGEWMKSALVWALALAGCGSSPAGESCTQAVCPTGGRTYRFCSAGNSCRYVSSDNQMFACVSCGQCSAAADRVANWCASFPMTTSGGTSGGTTGATSGGSTGATTGGTTGTVPTTIGASCVLDSDCLDGTNPSCRRNRNFSTGMCSAECSRDADCGANNVCLFAGGTSPGQCARTCQAAGDCGAGLGCWIAFSPQACWPLDGIAEFGVALTLDCDPSVAGCSFGGSPKKGGCSRHVLGPGAAGVCRQSCDIGSSQCPGLGGFQQSCYFVDETIDMMNAPTGDKLKQPLCVPDVPVGSPAKFIADGVECLEPDSMMHYFDICQPGSQCETYTLVSGATPDNKCHRLCYLGSFMLGPPDAGVAVTCPSGQSCTDIFATTGSTLPVGLCK
jgi:hypothetical protein